MTLETGFSILATLSTLALIATMATGVFIDPKHDRVWMRVFWWVLAAWLVSCGGFFLSLVL